MTSSDKLPKDKILINMTKVIDSPFCVASDDGQTLHNEIAKNIEAGASVSISFQGVERITTAFLNAAIGQLYNEFTEDVIKENLSIADAEPKHLSLLKKVVDGAKLYFKNPELYNSATNSVTGDDDD